MENMGTNSTKKINPLNSSRYGLGEEVERTKYGSVFTKTTEIYPWKSYIPLVFVEGDASEMGDQFGRATADIIRKVVRFNTPKLVSIFEKAHINANDYIGLAEDSIAKYTDSSYLDEVASMANASGVDYKDLMLTNLNIDIMYTLPSPESHYPLMPDDIAEESPLHCSFFSAWGKATKDDTLVAAHNDDGGRYMDQFLALKVAKPKHGKAFVSPVVPGYIGYHSVVNSANTFSCSTGISDVMKNEEMAEDGVPSWFLFRWLGQYSDGTSDAVKRFLSVPNRTLINWCFTSKKEGTRIVEATPKHHGFAKFPDASEHWIVSAGKTLASDLEPYLVTVKHPVTGDYRYLSIEKAVKEKYGKIDFDEGVKIMSDHYDSLVKRESASENTVCRHMEYAGTFGGTVRSLVVKFNNKTDALEQYTDIGVSLGNPCNGMWRKLSFDKDMNILN